MRDEQGRGNDSEVWWSGGCDKAGVGWCYQFINQLNLSVARREVERGKIPGAVPRNQQAQGQGDGRDREEKAGTAGVRQRAPQAACNTRPQGNKR